TPALSHALLLQAVPEPGVVAPTTPGSVTLYFTEAPVAQASHITILGPGGRRLPTGPVVAGGGVPRLSVRLLHELVPAVYTVQWSALANDGHITNGSFAFGTPGARGAPPPGAYKLTGTAAGGRGGENAAIDGPLPVIGRWLGILAAAVLLSGALLVASLRARGVPDGRALARRAAPFALLLLVIALVQGVYTAATAQGTTPFGFGV